jgi:hypothetical protein
MLRRSSSGGIAAPQRTYIDVPFYDVLVGLANEAMIVATLPEVAFHLDPSPALELDGEVGSGSAREYRRSVFPLGRGH